VSNYIVLGRFQPLHKGHEYLLNSAFDLAGDNKLTIAVGSAQKGWEANNPWTFDERQAMIQAWLDINNKTANIVGIDDINDPPNWVEHATQYHGEGILVTSDLATKELYEAADFPVDYIPLSNRDGYEGWRVRQTLLMLSTVFEDDAAKQVMSATIPSAVVEWLVNNDAIFRLSTMVSGMNVG
tara:strand:- start:5418 stop:5966 length:549 start_codon:yes stop_codon:yes gene_type:complete